MRIERLGEACVVLRELGNVAPSAVAERVRALAWQGLEDAVASYDTVGVHFDPDLFDPETADWQSATATTDAVEARRTFEVPVCYELGEDLHAVASHLGLTPQRVAELHASVAYRCFAIGFCPGFPYLGYLPEPLCGIPRLDTPRVKTEPGSVGITGRQTGIYPSEVPGGWPIIGRTPLTLVDLRSGYFPIAAGDIVRFVPVSPKEFEARKGERL